MTKEKLFRGANVTQLIKNLPAMQETQVRLLGWEDPLEKEMATHLCSCLENPMDRGAWQATVPGVARVGHDLATKPPPQALWSRSLKQHQSSEKA